MIVGGIEYLDEDAELFPDGSVYDATLAREVVVQGLPCAGGRSLVFYPSGRVKLAWLSLPSVVCGVPCSDAVLYLHENGRPLNASLAEDHRWAKLVLPARTRVTLDEKGELLEYSQRLEVDQLVEGLPCSAVFNVWRYLSGRTSLVVLSSPSLISGQEYPRGAEVAMDENGQVISWRGIDLDSGRRYKQRVFGVFEAGWQ
jgi:hypothetical protein